MLSKLVPVPSGSMIPDRDIGKRPILECISLGITFGGLKAVEDFNLTIGRTEIAGLIGPNGAGKTTAFNCITGVYEPTNGRVEFMGRPMIENFPQGKMAKTYLGENKGLSYPPPGPHSRQNHPAGHGPHLSEHPAVEKSDRFQ